MKRLISLLTITVFSITFLSPSFVFAKEKETMAVAEFVGKNVSSMDASVLSDFVRSALVETNEFRVVSRGNMATILAEQKFQATGCTDQECAVQIGKILNTQKIIIGTLSKLARTYYITINLVNVETGEIVYTGDTECESPKQLKLASKNLIYEMVGKKQIRPAYSQKLASLKTRKTIDLGIFVLTYVSTIVVDYAVDEELDPELLIPVAGPIIWASTGREHEKATSHRILAIISSVLQIGSLTDYFISYARQRKIKKKMKVSLLDSIGKKTKGLAFKIQKDRLNLAYNYRF